MRQLSFKRHRFPPDIIRHLIWLYARFTLSFRDVEEMLAERGLDVSYGATAKVSCNASQCLPPLVRTSQTSGRSASTRRRSLSKGI